MLEKLLLILNDICGELHALNTKLEGAVFEGVAAVPAPTVNENSDNRAAVGVGFLNPPDPAKVETPATTAGAKQKSPEPPTRKELGEALIALATDKGRDAAVAALAACGGAVALKDVTEKDYPILAAVIAKARQ